MGEPRDRPVGNNLVRFSTKSSGTAVHIHDELDGGDAIFYTDSQLSLRPATLDWFIPPVDAAVSFEASRLRLEHFTLVTVRDANAEHLGEFTKQPWNADRGTYYFEVSCGLKAYIYVENASFEGYLEDEPGSHPATVIEFDEPTKVVLGARSQHEQPAGKITVPDDPHAMMEAFSYLGSSIKEWSAERSWPTLRGYPPEIEFGDELHVPESLSKPDTGVTIGVPPTYADIYRVAPLAFYFGADLVPSDEPELRLDVGYTERLGRGQALEDAVDRLLAQGLVLDGLVRTAGYNTTPLHEYDKIAPLLHFYPPELYDRSVEQQLLEYLEVSFTDLESSVPEWPVTGVLRPKPGDAEFVPPLLASLGRIHVADGPDPVTSTRPSPASESAVTGHTSGTPPVGEALFTRSGFDNARERTLLLPSECAFSFIGGSEAHVDPLQETDWERFTVEEPGPTATIVSEPTCADLRQRLATDDFVYFAGHVTDEGFVCADGVLAPETLDSVGAAVVGCEHSPESAVPVSLVEAGAVTSILTEPSTTGSDIGAFARYLALGYPVAVSVSLARLDARLVGDATFSLTRRRAGNAPAIVDVVSTDPDTHRVCIWGVNTGTAPVGSTGRFTSPYHLEEIHLLGDKVETPTSLSASEVAAVADGDHLVRLNGNFHYGSRPTAADIRQSAQRMLEHDAE